MSLKDELQQTIALSPSSVVFVIGAGISKGAVRGTPCEANASWTDLLASGLQHARTLGTLDERSFAHLRQQLELDFPGSLLSVADAVTRALDGPRGGEFRLWLRDTVGGFSDNISNTGVLHAIADHQRRGVLITTTNYDLLLEKISGVRCATWRDPSQVERAIQGREPRIIHLHGVWEQPESVVLGTSSYDEVVQDKHARAVLTTLRTSRTFVFIGCGAGLRDPNIGAFLKWTEEVFAESEQRHFRLCLHQDVEALRSEHPHRQRIIPLPFGHSHSELAPFLRSLLPSDSFPSSQNSSPTPPPAHAGTFVAPGETAASLQPPQTTHTRPHTKPRIRLLATLISVLILTVGGGVIMSNLMETPQKGPPGNSAADKNYTTTAPLPSSASELQRLAPKSFPSQEREDSSVHPIGYAAHRSTGGVIGKRRISIQAEKLFGNEFMTMTFSTLSGGDFLMGDDNSGYDDERPQHRVQLWPFEISQREVTIDQWNAVMPSEKRRQCTSRGTPLWCPANEPAEEISWLDAVEFANALSRHQNLRPCYNIAGETVAWNLRCDGFRLPTEAEWEYAARAGSASLYSFGDTLEGYSRGAPNGWGLQAVHDGPWEWVWDRYAPYESESMKSPNGPDLAQGDLVFATLSSERVLRGGHYDKDATPARSAKRMSAHAIEGIERAGFRVARLPYPKE